ncbi:MAG TPA: metallopeptidase TldD-related protein [Candidatus Limnocylindrales bacterium]|nr:metallopeptidase TldD-related protein [Candidatus Limnocylindrales bacterium]
MTAATGTAPDVADRVLATVRERAGSEAAEAEVTVRFGTTALTRFATSFIHQNVADEVSHVVLRVALDGRTASSSLDGPTDDETLGRLVDNVIAAARVAPRDDGWPGLTPPTEGVDIDHWDDAAAAATPDDRATRVRAFVDAADGLETAGACSTAGIEAAFANSAGHAATGRATRNTIDGIARTPTADGVGRWTSARLADVDGAAAGQQAATRARAASDPIDLEPGRYEVILGQGAVSNLFTFLLVHGFNAKAVEEGRSFVRLGEQQFDPSISLLDDVGDPGLIGLGFDVEGTPRRPVGIVERGVSRAILHTRRTAKAAGGDATSTGHAIEGGGPFGALGASAVVAAGDRDHDALIGGVERGVYVVDFWYTRILDPRTQVVTGLTRNGLWLIENGKIGPAVRNLRFTQSFSEALAPGAVRAVGSERELLPSGFGSDLLVPSLHLASWNFTGGARG